MNIKFEPKRVEPEATEKILVSGEVVGKIYVNNDIANPGSWYMAQLIVPELSPASGLFGHGDTKEQAVVAALESGKKDTSLVLKFINKMESDLAHNSQVE